MKSVINIALSQYGVTEVAGEHHNPIILNYFDKIGHSWVETDETAWCSAFANWVALEAGMIYSKKLTARSWLKVGKEIKEPAIGDVVVFWRSKRNSWKGHVAFFVGFSEDKKYIYCLGGNQNNQINIKAYPSYRLLGFRELERMKPLIEEQ